MSKSHPNRKRSYGTGSLRIETGKSGEEVWYGRWRQNGKLVNRRIGSKAELPTKRAAERKLQETIGTAPTTTRPARGAVTFAQAAIAYRRTAELRGRKPSTLLNLESEVRVHLDPVLGDKPVANIGPREIVDLIDVLLGKGLAPKSVRNVVGTASAIFTYGKAPARGWCQLNPCEGAELPAATGEAPIRYLTTAELELLLVHVRPGIFADLDRVIFLTAAMTGLRRGELLALRWSEIDWTAPRVRVSSNFTRGAFGTPKTRRSVRSVPLSDRVLVELERWSQVSKFTADDDLVFAHPQTGEVLYPTGLARRLGKALTAAGLPARRFHDLRHTFGTSCAAAGVPMRTLQEWMGHKHLSTTERYAAYAPSTREADMIAAAFAAPTVADGTSDGSILRDLRAPRETSTPVTTGD